MKRAVPTVVRDAVAGTVTSVALIANIVSFSALMFPGVLANGAPVALWAMLVGSGLSGLWIAWRTSLPPLAVSIDSPTGAVLVLLSASAGASALAAGATPDAAVRAVMLLFSAATVVSGALLLGIGLSRRGALLRFVPYFVSAGFLAATGVLMIAGGVRMTGVRLGPRIADVDLAGALGSPSAARLAIAVAVLALLLALKRRVKSALALPAALLVLTVGGSLALRSLGLAAPGQGWFLPSVGDLQRWSPWQALGAAPLTWPQAVVALPELLAVAIVGLVSIVTKVSTLEIARKSYGDLDTELRAHGVGTLIAAPLGGVVGSLQIGSSRLLEQAGGMTRASGMACAAVLLLVGLSSIDLPSFVPAPLAAGLVFYLGWGFLVEALARPLAQRDLLNLLLVATIALACVRWGYLVGVLGGIVGACALFAFSYARTGVVRQRLSRAQFAGNVARSAAAMRHLADEGESIQLYWLAGYLFFGSSEGLFERVRRDFGALPPRRARYLVLDFALVTGADASGTASLGKLRNLCQQQGATLVLSALPGPVMRMLERDGLVGAKGQPPPMADTSVALAWCEDRLLADAAVAAVEDFPGWLQQQLGDAASADELLRYFERRSFDGPTVLYRQGEAADAIDLVAHGRLAVDIEGPHGHAQRVRTIDTHTAVGEMGFFRATVRSATVSTEGAAIVYTLTRDRFERLRRERPELALAFDEFLLRMLSERMVVTERMAAAVSP